MNNPPEPAPIPSDPLIDDFRAIRARLTERHGGDLRAMAEAFNETTRAREAAPEPPVIAEPAEDAQRRRRA